ncbi:toll/interleukin-1 receptor domain-containing protein [Pseudomonas brassicacearum]|uniref:toll/interleukin-1 receptor domain-containing protein n=1 Tax=Pseudomonas brassicacearum TaxID=930166 RepID=UPI003ECC4E12
MSWAEFMYSKNFGDGIYRPYADYMGDLAIQVDNLLGTDPPFARFTKSLVNRDFVFIRGARIALLCLSSSAHRHYPFRATPEWKDFFRIPEELFLAEHPGADKNAIVIRRTDVHKYLTDSLNFLTPICICFPAIFIPKDDSEEWKIRHSSVIQAAQLLINFDRTQYEEYIELQKPKNIFLSHKSPDKTLVREVASTLKSVGLAPWLDEDRMKAGANLERAILQGFQDSCAAVFFVTPRFIDDGYLASEIDYALAEKRTKGDKFSIITLLIPGEDGSFGEVPALLRTYVWKHVQPVEIVRAIAEALPIQCGAPAWRT